jgi:trehalose-6-phosphate synthase
MEKEEKYKNTVKRMYELENTLNDLIGENNKYSKELRKKQKDIQALKVSIDYYDFKSAFIKTTVKKTVLSFWSGLHEYNEIEVSVDVLSLLLDSYVEQAQKYCDECVKIINQLK